MEVDTTGWAEFPFEAQGVKFISKLDKDGTFYPQVLKIGEEKFRQYSVASVKELIGDLDDMEFWEIEKTLAVLNEGATQAVIELV